MDLCRWSRRVGSQHEVATSGGPCLVWPYANSPHATGLVQEVYWEAESESVKGCIGVGDLREAGRQEEERHEREKGVREEIGDKDWCARQEATGMRSAWRALLKGAHVA